MSVERILDIATSYARWADAYVGVGVPIPRNDEAGIVLWIMLNCPKAFSEPNEMWVRTEQPCPSSNESDESRAHCFEIGSMHCAECGLTIGTTDISGWVFGYSVDRTPDGFTQFVEHYDVVRHGPFGTRTIEEAARRGRALYDWQMRVKFTPPYYLLLPIDGDSCDVFVAAGKEDWSELGVSHAVGPYQDVNEAVSTAGLIRRGDLKPVWRTLDIRDYAKDDRA